MQQITNNNVNKKKKKDEMQDMKAIRVLRYSMPSMMNDDPIRYSCLSD